MTLEILLLILLVASSVVGIGLGVCLLVVSADAKRDKRILDETREVRDRYRDEAKALKADLEAMGAERDEILEDAVEIEFSLEDLQVKHDRLVEASLDAFNHLSGADDAMAALADALDCEDDDRDDGCCSNCCGCPVDEAAAEDESAG